MICYRLSVDLVLVVSLHLKYNVGAHAEADETVPAAAAVAVHAGCLRCSRAGIL
jgi:hypothetical protein